MCRVLEQQEGFCMDYQESLDYILGTPHPGNVYERDVMRPFLAKLGDPHKGLKYVHVAGTNGKGSVANMLASALAATGLKVGLYTSPHILIPHSKPI